MNVALPAVFTVALVYGRRYLRAFCIAALFPACLAMWSAWSRLTTLLTMGPRGFRFNQPQELELRISVFLQWGLIFAIGALGAGVWFVLAVIQFGGNRRRDKPQP